jgi:hypothetical protein
MTDDDVKHQAAGTSQPFDTLPVAEAGNDNTVIPDRRPFGKGIGIEKQAVNRVDRSLLIHSAKFHHGL